MADPTRFPRRNVDLTMPEAQRPSDWWAHPLNGQIHRRAIAVELIEQCSIGQIIETGTYLGTATAFFAGSGLPVITIERHEGLAADAAERLKPWPNVRVVSNDSTRAIRELLRDGIAREVPTFFCLDAHDGRHMPLPDELSLMLTYFPNAVAMIDDFNVPGDPGYGSDGPRFSVEHLLQGTLRRLVAFFPRARSETETGARRGSVALSATPACIAAMAKMPSLRRWL